MKASTSVLVLLLTSFSCLAQQNLAPSTRVSPDGASSTSSSAEQRAQIGHLRRAKSALADYLTTVPPDSEEYRKTEATIAEIEVKLKNLTSAAGASTTNSSAVVAPNSSTPPATPQFVIISPLAGRTNLSVEPALAWSGDRTNGSFKNPPLYNLKRFRVEIARDKEFTRVVCCDDAVNPASAKVTPDANSPLGTQSIQTTFKVPEDELQPGTTYYWRVYAVYTPNGAPNSVEVEQKVDGEPAFFITALDPFQPLTKRRFSLQRTVDSSDPTEGAQFSFLKTFGGKTVFTTDFAFFWQSGTRRFAGNKGAISFKPAVEGKLTSDKSTAEDAWRFSGSAVVDYSLGEDRRNLIESLYFELGANLESDQKFDTRKIASRVYFTPSSHRLAIGAATGDVSSKFQFRWRPSIEFNAGHTFDIGNSAERQSTIIRLVPRVRMVLFTRALSRFLKIADSDLYVDNTFYYLPKERFKTQHNFFTSGFEMFVIDNFGFALTYKHGESAPKFRPVHSFGGALTVRFGPK